MVYFILYCCMTILYQLFSRKVSTNFDELPYIDKAMKKAHENVCLFLANPVNLDTTLQVLLFPLYIVH